MQVMIIDGWKFVQIASSLLDMCHMDFNQEGPEYFKSVRKIFKWVFRDFKNQVLTSVPFDFPHSVLIGPDLSDFMTLLMVPLLVLWLRHSAACAESI